MKNLILLIIFLIPSIAAAQSSEVIRNDGASTTIQSNNLGNSKLSTTEKGELYVQSIQDPIACTQSGTWNVNNISGTVSLPTGASTLAKQDEIITAIGAIPGGGGTEYTEGDNVPTATGPVVLWKNGSDDVLAASTANPLPISIGAALPAGTNNIGDVDIASGTVTCNIGTIGTLATASRQDTANGLLATIDVDTSALAGTVSGTELQVDVLTMPVTAVSQSGTWNINNVSGTVSLPTGASTLAKQDEIITAIGAISAGDGAIEDGANAAIKATVLDYANSNPLGVRLTDTNGDYVAVAGGTQYSDGDNEPTPIGNVVMWQNGSDDILAASTANPLPVGVISSLPAGTNNIGDVDIASGTVTCNAGTNLNTSALATSAKQDTQTTELQDINSWTSSQAATVHGQGNTATFGNLVMGSDGTDAQRIKTDVGGELQVDVLTLPAIPAGTNNIGDVDVASIAAGNNNIGDVDVASIAAGNNNIGDVDVATIAAGNNNIGDVDVASVIPGTGATNLGKAEDAIHATGDTGNYVLAVRADTAAASGANGDYVSVTTDAVGKLWTAGDQVEDLVSGTGDRGAASLAVRADAVASTAANGDYEFLKVDGVGKLWTAGNQIEDALAATGDRGSAILGVRQDTLSASAGDGDYQAFKSNSLGSAYVSGQQADDAAIDASNNPHVIGGQAYTSVRSAVAANDVVRQAYDRHGRANVVPYCLGASCLSAFLDPASAATETIVAAAGANTSICVTSVTAANYNAASDAVELEDAGTATIRWATRLAANAQGGMTFPSPICIAANTALNVDAGNAGDWYMTVTYFITTVS